MNKLPINGVLLLNKSLGMSSNIALQRAKRIFNAEKAGHTGSLDPLATGMLPICFGEATKFSQFLLDADKTYVATGKLGEKTETADAEGAVIETKPVPELTPAAFEAVLDKFRGQSQQVPSMYSALKHQGRPLYELARQGMTVERAARAIHIHQLDLVDLSGDNFTIKVQCSKGTYIRNLVEDIGDEIGCGAHVTQLDRIGVANFTQNMYTLAELEQIQAQSVDELYKCLLPIDILVKALAKCELTNAQAKLLLQGQLVDFKGKNSQVGVHALYNEQHQFIGVGEILADGKIKAKRMMRQGACS